MNNPTKPQNITKVNKSKKNCREKR